MKNQSNTTNENENNASNLPFKDMTIKRIILGLGSGVAIPLIMQVLFSFINLFLEYKTGWFIPLPDTFGKIIEPKVIPSIPANLTIVLMTMIVCRSFSIFIKIWIAPYKNTREIFSLHVIFFIFYFSLTLMICFLYGAFPWDAVLNLYYIFMQKPLVPPDIRVSDYIWTLIAVVLVFVPINSRYANWKKAGGLISIADKKREDNAKDDNFINCGLREILRIFRGEPPSPPIPNIDTRHLEPRLRPIPDEMTSWEAESRNLICLKSQSYLFDPEEWHDNEDCWIGQNKDTQDLVVLHPAQEVINDAQIDSLINYADRLAKTRKSPGYELIIAINEDGLSEWTQSKSNKTSQQSITIVTKVALLKNLVDFSNYRRDIKRRATQDRLTDSNLSISDVYVSPQYAVSETDSSDFTNHLVSWLSDPSRRQIALLGEYGQGKSTVALMLAHQILETKIISSRIPILIELRGKSPRNVTPLELLGAWSAKYSINALSLMKLHTEGKLLLIFEGFDEMALVGDSDMRLKHFDTLWQFAHKNSKLIITGRPNFFLDEEEMKAALGIDKPLGDLPYCEALRLKSFGIHQISNSLRAYKDEVRNQICEFASKNPRFLELISRPSLLHIVATLWEQGKLADKLDQLNSAYIMDLFVRNSYRRQGLKQTNGNILEFMALTSLEREYFMKGIAAYMAAEKFQNQISGPQLNDIIGKLIQVMPPQVSVDALPISGEAREPLQQRVAKSEYGVEHVITDVRTCGLLVDDPSSIGMFRFGHKSFMEFLFASVIGDLIKDPKSIISKSILLASESQVVHITRLQVSIEFLADIVSDLQKNSDVRKDPLHYTHQENFADNLFKIIVGDSLLEKYRLNLFVLSILIRRRLRNPQDISDFTLEDLFSTRNNSRLILNNIKNIFFTITVLYTIFFAIFLAFYGFSREIPAFYLFNGFQKNPGSLVSTLEPTLTILITLIMSIMIITHSYILLTSLSLNKILGLKLWNFLCNEIKIKDVFMYKVAKIPSSLTKDKKFNYFISGFVTKKSSRPPFA